MLSVDPQTRVATWQDGPLDLTTAEFDLLWFLARHPGQVLDRDQLHEGVRGVTWDGVDRSIDLRVSRLRRKLSSAGAPDTLIKAVRGAGYLLAPS